MISKTSEHSRRITIEEIINSNPEIIIIMPCGFDVKRTEIEYKKFLTTNQKWNSLEAVKQGNVFAVDANSFFSKPSIRTITGIEILAKIIQPNLCTETKIPERSSTRLDNY